MFGKRDTGMIQTLTHCFNFAGGGEIFLTM